MAWGQFHPFQAPIQGSRGPKMPILWLEQDQNGWAAPGWTSPPGKCLVRHITPQCMGERDLGPFSPAPGTYPGRGGSKNGYFYGKNQTNMAGLRQASPSHLESVQCAISHPNAWESMT